MRRSPPRNPVVVPMPGSEPLASRLAVRLGSELSPSHEASIADRELVLVGALCDPHRELLPLLLLTHRARARGARTSYLVAPRISLGSSAAGAVRETLSRHFTGIVTVAGGPESAPAGPWEVASAGPGLSAAIKARPDRPALVVAGDTWPWMEEVAAASNAPLYAAARLHGEIASRGPAFLGPRRPVLLAEAIGDGRALAQLARALRIHGASAPVVCVVHADFETNAADELAGAGVCGVVSTNTLLDPSNRVDVSEPIADALWRLWEPTEAIIERTRGEALAAS